MCVTQGPIGDPLIKYSVLTFSGGEKKHVLALCLSTGIIHLMNSYDDPSPRIIHTGLTGEYTKSLSLYCATQLDVS